MEQENQQTEPARWVYFAAYFIYIALAIYVTVISYDYISDLIADHIKDFGYRRRDIIYFTAPFDIFINVISFIAVYCVFYKLRVEKVYPWFILHNMFGVGRLAISIIHAPSLGNDTKPYFVIVVYFFSVLICYLFISRIFRFFKRY